MKTGNIGIRNLADIGVSDIDVYGIRKNKKILDINSVKVRVNSTYNGEFGFDWIDVNDITGEILKIQGVDFSEAEYFYKNPINQNDIGNFVSISSDINGAKDAIKRNYELLVIKNNNQIVDIPWVFIKPNQTIELSLEINKDEKSISSFDKISIFGDEYYDFEIVSKKNTANKVGKKAEIEVSEINEPIFLKIKCLKEAPEKKYEIFGEVISGNPVKIGGLTMMGNKILKLKFRVIALVSSDGNPSAKAKILFQKFKDSDIKKHLNENSLNQAGYEIEIENQAMFDTLESSDLDDYFYSFDKADWTVKKYFANINKEKDDVDATGHCKITSWDPVNKKCAKIIVPTDVIVDNQKDLGLADKDNEMDAIVITEYKNKLKTKSKTYEGGIIILSDFESSDKNIGAYSRISPFNHYALMVYSTNIDSKDTYAHEIGHMLGLNHTFYFGNEGFEKVWKGLEDIKKYIAEVRNLTGRLQINKLITTRKKIVLALNNAINNLTIEITKRNNDYAVAKNMNGNFTFGGVPVTKEKFLEESKKVITALEKQKKSNQDAVKEFKDKKENIYLEFSKKDSSMYILLAPDFIKIQEDYLNFYSKFLAENYIIYKQGSTKNMMDYNNTRTFYQHHQILTMRKDYENY